MSQIDKETLSALLDNEADELELRRILKASEQDPSLLQTWERYNLAQSLMHESAVPVSPELSQRIAQQIELEQLPATTKSTASGWQNWQQQLGKVAVAASVALVFVVVMQTGLESTDNTNLVQNSQTANQSTDALPQATPDAILVVAETRSTAVDPVAEQRLREYIQTMAIDEEEPVLIEHLQDSPLYRLVNELEAKP